MKLEEILGLRPPSGATAAECRDAIARAMELRFRFDQQEQAAKLERRESVLTTDDKGLLAAERGAAAHRLTVERIDALLPAIRADLIIAEAKEEFAALHTEAASAASAVSAYQAWLADGFQKICEIARQGIVLEDAARAAHQGFLLRADAAYRRLEVRDLGVLDVTLPDPPTSSVRAAFRGWTL